MTQKRFLAGDTAQFGSNRTDPGLYQDPVSGMVTLIRTDGVSIKLQAASAPRRQTLVIFGDSITAQNINGAAQNSASANGYWTQAQLQLRHRFLLLNDAGVGGNKTADMLARIQTDVLAYQPGWCLVQGGGNDVSNAVSSATIISNLTAIYQALIEAGIKVIATTVLPSSTQDTAAELLVQTTVNNWIRSYAQANQGIVLCDWYSWYADPTTGLNYTGLTSDGTHPNQAGAVALATPLVAALSPITTLNDPLPFANGAENTHALPNPRMVGNTGGVATSVTIAANSGSPTLTKTKVARADGIPGEWQQVVASGGTDNFRVQQQMATNVGSAGAIAAVGDYVYAVAEVELDSGATMVGAGGEVPLQLTILNQDAAGTPYITDNFASTGDGTYAGTIPTGRMVLRTPNYQLPTGTSRLFVRVVAFVNGTVRVGRMQIYKASVTSVYG